MNQHQLENRIVIVVNCQLLCKISQFELVVSHLCVSSVGIDEISSLDFRSVFRLLIVRSLKHARPCVQCSLFSHVYVTHCIAFVLLPLFLFQSSPIDR